MEKVLIVDDEYETRERLKKVVEREGFEVFLAADGAEALDVFQRERPGIVATDLKMPKIDGMELLHSVKKIDPLTQVILITAHGDYDLAIHALRGGALDYLRKPIDLDQLFVAFGRAQEVLSKYKNRSTLPTILLVDDDEGARNKLERVLLMENYGVLTAADGEEALQKFVDAKVDIVMTDLRMPGKGGLGLLREIRTLTDDVETIVVTGYGDEGTAVQALREGAANYLRKPIDLDQMLVAISKAYETLNLRRSLLYRMRDLELAHEVVAKLTSRKGLLIDVRTGQRTSVIDFAENLLDAIPLSLLVIDKDLNVLFANNAFRDHAGQDAGTVSNEVFDRLGVADLSLNTFKDLVEGLLASTEPRVERLEVDGNVCAVMTKLFVITDEGTEKLVLAVLDSQRPRGRPA